MNSLLALQLGLALAGGPAVKADPCKGHLDAVVVDGVRCQSPAHEPDVVVADTKPAPPPLVRDPAIFPGELGFFSAVLALSGGAIVTLAYVQDPARLSADEAVVRDGVMIGGATVLSLSALVGAAALSTWVFDPSTATLRLPIFEGEPR